LSPSVLCTVFEGGVGFIRCRIAVASGQTKMLLWMLYSNAISLSNKFETPVH